MPLVPPRILRPHPLPRNAASPLNLQPRGAIPPSWANLPLTHRRQLIALLGTMLLRTLRADHAPLEQSDEREEQ